MQGFKKKWADFEEKHPKLVPVILFLGILNGSNGIAVSDVYLFAVFVWYRASRC